MSRSALMALNLGLSRSGAKQPDAGAAETGQPGAPSQSGAGGTGDVVHHLHKAFAAHKKGDHKAARKHALNYANATLGGTNVSTDEASQAPGSAPTVPAGAGGTF